MEAINITILPNVKRSESTGIRIGKQTNERLVELADRMDMSVSRVTDYLLNVALDNVNLIIAGKEDAE